MCSACGALVCSACKPALVGRRGAPCPAAATPSTCGATGRPWRASSASSRRRRRAAATRRPAELALARAGAAGGRRAGGAARAGVDARRGLGTVDRAADAAAGLEGPEVEARDAARARALALWRARGAGCQRARAAAAQRREAATRPAVGRSGVASTERWRLDATPGSAGASVVSAQADGAEAARWLELAAENRVPEAACALGAAPRGTLSGALSSRSRGRAPRRRPLLTAAVSLVAAAREAVVPARERVRRVRAAPGPPARSRRRRRPGQRAVQPRCSTATNKNCEADQAQAVKYYKLAADRGHGKAALNLACMYHAGAGAAQDLGGASRAAPAAAQRRSATAPAQVLRRRRGAAPARGRGQGEAPRVLALAGAPRPQGATRRPIEDYPELHRLMKNEDRRVKRFPHLKNFLGPTLPGADYIPGRDDDDGPGQAAKECEIPNFKAPISAVFHSFRLIFGRVIILGALSKRGNQSSVGRCRDRADKPTMSVLAAADAGLVAERAAPPAAAADDVASATLAAQARVVDALSYVEPYAAAAGSAEASFAAARRRPRRARARGVGRGPRAARGLRYAARAPPTAPRGGRAAADNAAAQLGHQANRVVNLELAEAFGEAAWRRHAADLASGAAAGGASAAAERVNAARRADQERLAPEILRAERRCAARLERAR
ncbi:hypothetical protein JL720_47 [Aureococcus anophagefferens]|nr:hypothetical protein JL720_47 [Aureococcus anophagefferens]